jgi:hypothetical protein
MEEMRLKSTALRGVKDNKMFYVMKSLVSGWLAGLKKLSMVDIR